MIQAQKQARICYEGYTKSLWLPMIQAKAEQLKEQNKFNEIFGLILAVSLQSVDLSLKFNKEDQKKLVEDFQIGDKKGEDLLKTAKEQLNCCKDILSTFSFIGDTVNVLKDQGVKKFQLLIRVDELAVSLTIDGNFYQIIEDLEIF